ncbi:MAG TPA: hypothetical protein VFU73_06580 [Actinocrinis sp.]|nr:hypothetical protein [Actinocrinis sp.]
MDDSAWLETDMVDLEDYTVDEVHELDQADLSPSVDIIRQQVERPRANLGGSGPPGRAD